VTRPGQRQGTADGKLRRRARQASIPRRRRVEHEVVSTVLEEEKAVAAAVYGGLVRTHGSSGARFAVALFVVRGARAEEGTRRVLASQLGDEDAWEVSPGKVVWAEEVMGVDHGPPRTAHAPAAGEGAHWETTKDVEENVVGETDRVVVAVARVHRDGSRDRSAVCFRNPSKVRSERRRAILSRFYISTLTRLDLGFLFFFPTESFSGTFLRGGEPS
jgi:hypothetical protein